MIGDWPQDDIEWLRDQVGNVVDRANWFTTAPWPPA